MSQCVICGENGSRVLYRGTDRLCQTTTDVFAVVECRHCGMARLHPQPPALARYYPPLYWFPGGPADAYRKFVIRDHVRFVIEALGKGTRVLDAGSGGGLLAALLRQRGIQAYALDISPAAAAIALRAAVPAIAADFADPPFAEHSWDLIAMFHALEHVPNPRQHLSVAHRMLAPGGSLVVAVPNFDSLQRRIFGARWNGLDIPRHLHHFRARDLQSLLEQTGFRLARTRHFSWRDSPAGLATTLAPGFDPVARLIRQHLDRSLAVAAQNERFRAARASKRYAGRHNVANAVYAALTALCIPFAALEAATKRGSVVMMQAVRL